MSWMERSVEERLARAAADGELETPHLKGKPIADLDRPRRPVRPFGQRAEAAAAAARAGFWQAPTIDDLRQRVRDANAAIGHANVNLVEADRLDCFDPGDVEARWRQLHG